MLEGFRPNPAFARMALALGMGTALVVAAPAGALAQAQGQGGGESARQPAQTIQPPIAAPAPESFADLVEPLMDAVVNISTSQTVEREGGTDGMPQVPPGSPFEEFFEEFFERRGEGGQQRTPRRVNSLGSGFVIDPGGIIVTNNHVIQDADEIEVNMRDGRTLQAEVIGRDPQTDLALIQVDSEEELPAVEFGDSDELRIGEWVVAIGNPFGLGTAVSAGIVSAVERDINAGPYDNFIQTDAAINRGNSGGPLFNTQGEVIGINTAIISPSGGSIGIGFAVPSASAQPIIDQLREYGETRRGFIGVRIQSVSDDIAESLGMERARGALVAGVTDDGPAGDAGIEPGDVILEFDGQNVPEMRDLPRIVADTEIGRDVEVRILRDGAEQTLTMEVARLEEGGEEDGAVPDEGAAPDEQPGEDETPQEMLGLTLSSLDDEARQEYGIGDEVDGVLIAEVDPTSDAAEKQVARGSVIVEIAQQRVASPQEAMQAVEQLREEGRRTALMLLSDAEGELRFVAIALGDDG